MSRKAFVRTGMPLLIAASENEARIHGSYSSICLATKLPETTTEAGQNGVIWWTRPLKKARLRRQKRSSLIFGRAFCVRQVSHGRRRTTPHHVIGEKGSVCSRYAEFFLLTGQRLPSIQANGLFREGKFQLAAHFEDRLLAFSDQLPVFRKRSHQNGHGDG